MLFLFEIIISRVLTRHALHRRSNGGCFYFARNRTMLRGALELRTKYRGANIVGIIHQHKSSVALVKLIMLLNVIAIADVTALLMSFPVDPLLFILTVRPRRIF